MKTSLQIEGMSCEKCAAHVTESLSGLTGVSSVQVSLADKQAVVEHDDAVSMEALKEAVNDAGYDVK
ncbi:MAG: heavy-metal-associated domain-containing protein [Treponema sp.]|jgi:copper ion binding protein|nr:heavy-metal-associated domain-containing protein [Treponema sp.]